jgi:D-sedoheptulose 7-phosphate isomerase
MRIQMNRLEKIYSNSQSGKDYARGYLSYLTELCGTLDLAAIEKMIGVFEKARDNGKTIFMAGNGGSAATCSHFAEDLTYGTIVDGKKPYKALSLVDNSAYLTAVGNDEGYENLFMAQLRPLFNAGDVLVAISVSGNSPNLLRAIDYANNKNGITVGIVGFDGGSMKNACHHCVHVSTLKGEYGPVEDIHLILVHLITTYLAFRLGKTKRD